MEKSDYTTREAIRDVLYEFAQIVKEDCIFAKRWVWNAHIKILLLNLRDLRYKFGWQKEDEFRADLNLDMLAWLAMNDEQKVKYMYDIACRREAAHERTLHDH